MVRVRLAIVWHGAVTRASRLWIENVAARLDMDVTLISPSSWSAVLPRRTDFTSDGQEDYRIQVLKPHVSFHGATFFLSGLKRAFRESNPDVVLAIEEPFSLVMAQVVRILNRLTPRPRLICHTYQNIWKRYPPPFRWIESRVLQRADGMLGSCPEVLEVLERKGYRGPLRVFPQSVDLDLWRPIPRALGSERDRRIHIGYVGRFVQEKGVDTLLAACRLLTFPYRLTLVGDGPLEAEIRRQISGLEVATILNNLLPLQIANIYPTFDMLVVPSRTRRNWKEQFGRVLIEAMACGVPVIGSDSGAIPWVIGEAGRIFPEGDATALAKEISMLADSRELREDIGEKARARVVEHFSTKVVVDGLLEFIEEVSA